MKQKIKIKNKKLVPFEAKSKKIIKARKLVKNLEQRYRKTRAMARRLLDGATAAGTLEGWFNLEDNFGNQGIVESEDSEEDQQSPEEYEVASSSIVNRQNSSAYIKLPDNNE